MVLYSFLVHSFIHLNVFDYSVQRKLSSNLNLNLNFLSAGEDGLLTF